MIFAVAIAAALVAAGSGGGVQVRAAAADGAIARSKAVVEYAARAVAKNRNFTGDLRRAWQHMVRAGDLRRGGDNAAATRHALRARELGRRAIVANGWRLKRAFMRDAAFERELMAGVAVGEIDRAVDEIAAREEFMAAANR